MEIPKLTRNIEEILRAKTQEPRETQGYLFYMRGQRTPSGHAEAIIPIETGIGTAGSVTRHPQAIRAVERTLNSDLRLGVVEFHVHPAILGEDWADRLSTFADIPVIKEALAEDPTYIHLFMSPKLYTFLGKSSTSATGIGGPVYQWGSAPVRTSF